MVEDARAKRGPPGALIVLGLIAALAAGVVGIALAEGYLPHAPGVRLGDLQEPYRRSARLADAHRVATWLLLATSAASVLALALRIGQAPANRARAVTANLASVVAVAAAISMLATTDVVAWDQLAMRAVPSGVDASGYRFAAFDHDVRFVLADGHERTQAQYRAVMFVHLGAPFVASGALVVALVEARARRVRHDVPSGDDPSTAPAGGSTPAA